MPYFDVMLLFIAGCLIVMAICMLIIYPVFSILMFVLKGEDIDDSVFFSLVLWGCITFFLGIPYIIWLFVGG